MVRTSLVLPTPLHHRLVASAKEEQKSISQLICDLLDQALTTKQNAKLKKMYAALDKLDGLGSGQITDASTTINQTLYTEHATE